MTRAPIYVAKGVDAMDIRLIDDEGAHKCLTEDLPGLLARDDVLIWVDIQECDEDAIRTLHQVFAFHPMAVHNFAERNRVPKMHAYSDHVLVVLHAPEPGERGHVHY